MFAATKSTAFNSRNKFVQELNENEHKLFNRSFDTASKILTKSGNLKQPKLCLNTSWKRTKLDPDKMYKRSGDLKPEILHGKIEGKQEAVVTPFLLPRPQTAQGIKEPVKRSGLKRGVTEFPICAAHEPQRESVQTDRVKEANPLTKPGRGLISVVGRVDFCLKIHKIHPDVNAIWDVYGKLIKTINGKQRNEYIMLMRSDGGGPILQAVYYDFTNILNRLQISAYIRVVGRFVGCNRLNTFKVNQIETPPTDERFTRIQNVTSFAMLQNEINNSTNLA